MDAWRAIPSGAERRSSVIGYIDGGEMAMYEITVLAHCTDFCSYEIEPFCGSNAWSLPLCVLISFRLAALLLVLGLQQN